MSADIAALLAGEVRSLYVAPDQALQADAAPADALLLPGSFNPLHRGHTQLLRCAEHLSGRSGVLELSVTNVDKPSLTKDEVVCRVASMGQRWPVLLTRAPTFMEKAALIPGAWFVLGYDTAVRLLSPDYHADVPGMLTQFRKAGIRFYVGGRLQGDRFLTGELLPIPAGFESLFVPIGSTRFREDISSSGIRAAQSFPEG
jgi:hypothetical protein